MERSAKMLGGGDAVLQATKLSQSVDAVQSSPIISKPIGQGASMPESFADLLQVHGVDATLWEEMNQPLGDCISPLRTPVSTFQLNDQPNVEGSVLEVCASPQSFLVEEPAIVMAESRLTDTIPRTEKVSSSGGLRRKQKTANSSPSSKHDKTKSEGGREDNGGAGQKMKVAEKENLKRSSDDDERPLPERLSLRNSPKRTKVQPPPSSETSAQLKSIVAPKGNFRIPLKENRKLNDNGTHNRDDGLSMPPPSNATRRDKYDYDRHGSNRRCRIDEGSSRSTDHH